MLAYVTTPLTLKHSPSTVKGVDSDVSSMGGFGFGTRFKAFKRLFSVGPWSILTI